MFCNIISLAALRRSRDAHKADVDNKASINYSETKDTVTDGLPEKTNTSNKPADRSEITENTIKRGILLSSCPRDQDGLCSKIFCMYLNF